MENRQPMFDFSPNEPRIRRTQGGVSRLYTSGGVVRYYNGAQVPRFVSRKADGWSIQIRSGSVRGGPMGSLQAARLHQAAMIEDGVIDGKVKAHQTCCNRKEIN